MTFTFLHVRGQHSDIITITPTLCRSSCASLSWCSRRRQWRTLASSEAASDVEATEAAASVGAVMVADSAEATADTAAEATAAASAEATEAEATEAEATAASARVAGTDKKARRRRWPTHAQDTAHARFPEDYLFLFAKIKMKPQEGVSSYLPASGKVAVSPVVCNNQEPRVEEVLDNDINVLFFRT